MENRNQPAFPLVNQEGNSIEDREVKYGLTKREYFAGLAMQGLLSNPARLERYIVNGFYIEPKELSSDAIACADELLKQLQS